MPPYYTLPGTPPVYTVHSVLPGTPSPADTLPEEGALGSNP